MDTLDRIAYAEMGLTPREVDALSWRDFWVMLSGARDREKARWQHTSVVAQAIMNHGGNGLRKPRPLLDLYHQMFGRATSNATDQGRMRSLLSSISTKKDAG